MKENINKADSALQTLSIIEKARALSWYRDVDFGDGILVNVDDIGYGTKRFYVTGATIEGVFAYPKSDFYGPGDSELLESWCSGDPYIEKDRDSHELERILDGGLRDTGIDKDNPVVTNDYKYHPDSVIFEGAIPRN